MLGIGMPPDVGGLDIDRIRNREFPLDSLTFRDAHFVLWRTSAGWTEARSVSGRVRGHKVFKTLADYIVYHKSEKTLNNYKVWDITPDSKEYPKPQVKTVLLISTIVGVLGVPTGYGGYELPKISADTVEEAVFRHREEMLYYTGAETKVVNTGEEINGYVILRGSLETVPKHNMRMFCEYELAETFKSTVDRELLFKSPSWIRTARPDLYMRSFLMKRGWEVEYKYKDDEYPELPHNSVEWIKEGKRLHKSRDGVVFTRENGLVFDGIFEAATYDTEEYRGYVKLLQAECDKANTRHSDTVNFSDKGIVMFRRDGGIYGVPDWCAIIEDRLAIEGMESFEGLKKLIENKYGR